MLLFTAVSILLSAFVLVRCFRRGKLQSIHGYFYTLLVLYVVPIFCIKMGFDPEGFGWFAAYLTAISSSLLIASFFRPYRIVNYLDSLSERGLMWKRYMGDTAEYAEWRANLKKYRRYFLIMLGIFPIFFTICGFIATSIH